jgi:hypothetical protein
MLTDPERNPAVAISVLSRDETRKAIVTDDSITYYRSVRHGSGERSWRFVRETTPSVPFHAKLNVADAILNAPPKIYLGR